MKNVLINIITTQIINDEESITEFTTVGKYGFRDGVSCFIYEENSEVGAEGVKTTLKVDDRQISLQRKGNINGKMLIEKGQRHICHYSNSGFNFTIGVFGEDVDNNLDFDGGSLSMKYTLDINCDLLSRNKIEIKVRKMREENTAMQ